MATWKELLGTTKPKPGQSAPPKWVFLVPGLCALVAFFVADGFWLSIGLAVVFSMAAQLVINWYLAHRADDSG